MIPNSIRPLPDPEINLRDARDFIMDSRLARKAVTSKMQGLSLFVHDFLSETHRLVQSCHMPEFTDHGLPHLCSLVDRISRWTLKSDYDEPRYLIEDLEAEEAAILLLATLFHDIGMLSQNPIDLPDEPTVTRFRNHDALSDWVRRTHCQRLRKLIFRMASRSEGNVVLNEDAVEQSIEIGTSHSIWPQDWQGNWSNKPRLRALASVLAVCDLFDEDSARCDTITLIEHREGTDLNRAHWIRHGLTQNRLLVDSGHVAIQMCRPPDTTNVLSPAFSALRNHLTLSYVYNTDLSPLGASISIDFNHCKGIPDDINTGLGDWKTLPGFANETALLYQLLQTFRSMPLVYNHPNWLNEVERQMLSMLPLENVALTLLQSIEEVRIPQTQYEKIFSAIMRDHGHAT